MERGSSPSRAKEPEVLPFVLGLPSGEGLTFPLMLSLRYRFQILPPIWIFRRRQ